MTVALPFVQQNVAAEKRGAVRIPKDNGAVLRGGRQESGVGGGCDGRDRVFMSSLEVVVCWCC